MKYNININQKSIIDLGLDMDLFDAAILDHILFFSHSSEINKLSYQGYIYYWFSHSNIISGLPMLELKKDTVYRRMKKLCDIGLLEAHPDCKMLGRSYYRITDLSLKVYYGNKSDTTDLNPMGYGNKSDGGTDLNPMDNNIIYNNIKDNSNVSETKVSTTTPEQKKEVQQSLFPETELVNPENKTPKKVAQKKVKKESEPDNEVKRLFRNSDVYKMAKFDENKNGDYSEFENRFNTPEFEPIDLVYYFNIVSDWSDLKNEKRTKNGWIATVRTFIRGDAEKNKVKLKPEFQPNKNDDNQAMLDILNSR